MGAGWKTLMTKKDLVVIGNGMVGHRFIELVLESEQRSRWNIVTFCEEARLAYDRVNLTSFFGGKTAEELSLASPTFYEQAGVTVHVGEQAASIDRGRRMVTSASGKNVTYDKLVLATGSFPLVPPIPGREAQGCFVYRTIEDLERIRAWAEQVETGVVIGGGLLGLEAANALTRMGLETHVVEFAPRLMSMQVDEGGGQILRAKIEALGVSVHTGKNTSQIVSAGGRVVELRFADGGALATGMVVFSAGIGARDELARECGLAIGERGGVVIDDRCRTSDPDVLAIGECAQYRERTYGLIGPGYQMARTAVSTLAGGEDRLGVFDMSTKLKLLGVDVASFGDAFGDPTGAAGSSPSPTQSRASTRSWWSAPDRKLLLGGVLVGEASRLRRSCCSSCRTRCRFRAQPEQLDPPPGGGRAFGRDSASTRCPRPPPSALARTSAKGVICRAIRDQQLPSVAAVKTATMAGTGCGSCVAAAGRTPQRAR